jgi:hypothetical protein
MTTTNILQQSEEYDRSNATQGELTSDEMAKIHGGSLYEACCKGTHIPDVVIELW